MLPDASATPDPQATPGERPLRIAFDLTFAHDRGGTGRYLREMQQALAARPDVDLLLWRGWRVDALPRGLRLPLNLVLHLFATQVLLPHWARRQRADLLWCSMVAPIWQPVPVALTLHDALDAVPHLRSSRLWSAYMRWISAVAARRARWLFTGSHAAAREIASAYRVSAERVAVTPYGVTPPAAHDAHVHPMATLDGVPYVLLVGSHGARKRHDIVVTAVERLRAQGWALHLVSVGRSTKDAMRFPWVHGLQGVSDTELSALYAGAAVVALPSLHEGYGLPAVEARRVGTPVVSANLPAVREAVPDATFVSGWSVDAWAAALAAAMSGRSHGPSSVPPFGWDATAQASLDALRATVTSPSDPTVREAQTISDQQLRVLVLHPSDDAYGADRWLQSVLRDVPLDVDVTVSLPPHPRLLPGPMRTWLASNSIATHTLPMPVAARRGVIGPLAAVLLGFRLLFGTLALVCHMRRVRPDVVVTNTLALPVGPLAAMVARIPHVWHVHEVISDEPPLLRWMLRTAVRRLPGQVVANSYATANALPSGALGQRLQVVPNGIDVCAVVPRRDREPADGDGPLRVAVVGRLSTRKGWREALQALALLPTARSDIPGVTLDWFGDPPTDAPHALDQARELAAQLDVTHTATFHGYVPDAVQRLASFDVLLLPSQRPESFSLAVLEGMAAGCAVVAVRLGGGSDALVEHGVSGLLCAPEPAAMAAALQTLYDDRGLVCAMGLAGQRRAADFSAAAMRAEVWRIWREAACATRSSTAARHPSTVRST